MSTSTAPLDFSRLRALFQPSSVAILGASDDPAKISGRTVRYLLESGYKGRILPINPRRDQVQGLQAYPAVEQVPGDIDLAIVALPATLVLEAVQACADRGVRALILFSAGFAETGEAGRRQQARLTRIARESGMRILGPNCLGAINLRHGMIGTFTSGMEGGLSQPGRIGFVSQSGALGSHCFAAFRERGLGFSYWVTTGNECDLEFADCLAFLAQDPDTDVIAAYIEGCRDGEKLKKALEVARQNRKPVILLKVGESEIGAQAAASHTASLAGSDAVYDAVFRQYGVCRAHSITEFMELTYACLGRRFPAGDRIGLATVSGGVGVLMADRASALGLDVAPMPQAAQQWMKQRWAPAAVANPVDTTAQVTSDRALLTEFVEKMLDQGDYHALVIFLAHTGLVKETSDRLRDQLRTLRQRYPERLIIISTLCTPAIRADYEGDGFPVFEDPSVAVQAAAELMRLGRQFKAAEAGGNGVPLFHGGGLPAPPAHLNEFTVKQYLAEACVPVVDERLAHSADDAASAAAEVGYPVVLKIVSPDIAHKTEAGGVILNLVNPTQVQSAYRQIIKRIRCRHPAARIDGVLVSRMVIGGTETLIGVQRDPVFGPVVAFGLGGIFVETLKDVALRPAPFGLEEAHSMIREIQGYPLLSGARNRPPADTDALARALVAVSQVASRNRHSLLSMDINPFIVLPRGEGAVAVDALMIQASDNAAPAPGNATHEAPCHAS
ncbi:acetate--CoA ligase family protein [Alloalcanivorax mobilis]|uniref:acetate--CoA ligase family protein n=1 Tax=Alloalcanivorax mobilis TaxID=2019569 RepID=UPI000C7907CC|nr:acetate--CoA ligase family protein [Alloalcanivorax mobilis]